MPVRLLECLLVVAVLACLAWRPRTQPPTPPVVESPHVVVHQLASSGYINREDFLAIRGQLNPAHRYRLACLTPVAETLFEAGELNVPTQGVWEDLGDNAVTLLAYEPPTGPTQYFRVVARRLYDRSSVRRWLVVSRPTDHLSSSKPDFNSSFVNDGRPYFR